MELLKSFLIAVLVAAIPACSIFFVQFLRKMISQIEQETESTELKALLDEVSHAVSTAVAYTSQVLVDELKSRGEFTEKAQEASLMLCLDMVEQMISPMAIERIKEYFGSMKAFVEPLIEAEVRRQKLADVGAAK